MTPPDTNTTFDSLTAHDMDKQYTHLPNSVEK